MGVKNIVRRVGEKTGDKVAHLSKLSPAQIIDVQAKREEYLLEMPKPDDEVARSITEKMMAASSIEVFNAFLPQIKELYLPMIEAAEYDEDFDVDFNVRYFNITKWVTDKKENNLPSQMSGGQQQRVAIARAIVNDAPLILADEPTGNLDTKTSIDVMEFFVNLNEKLGKTIVLVTHEPDIAEYTKRILRFKDGKIIEDIRRRI